MLFCFIAAIKNKSTDQIELQPTAETLSEIRLY